MQMLLSDIAQIVGGTLSNNVFPAITVGQVSINTRTLQPGDLYIAIKGQQFDGNDFIEQAVQAGAVAAIVEKNVHAAIPCIQVADTRIALKELAAAWRQSLSLKIAGVTGSNGKTTVKEMLASILGVNAPVWYTQGNLNNDIGVPLTLLCLKPEHRYAVIEMGANHAGEIAYTSSFVAADVVIINNVGAAHIEGFGSLEGIAKAKGELVETLKAAGVAVLNYDDAFYPYWRELAGQRRVISFGLGDAADISAREINTAIVEGVFCTQFILQTATGERLLKLKLAGRHNVLNALAATAAAQSLGIELEQIQQGLESMTPVKGRMQPVIGMNGNVVINDTYNANPSSLAVALDVLLECQGEPWVALGAFGELGAESRSIHADLGTMLKAKGVTRLFAIGLHADATVAAFGEGGQFFANQEDLITALQHDLSGDAIILCKGSRLQKMENVVNSLCGAMGN